MVQVDSKTCCFAIWVANSNVEDEFIMSFKTVLENAVVHKNEIAEKYASEYSYFDLKDYLRNKICYRIGKNEIESMNLYKKLLKELSD